MNSLIVSSLSNSVSFPKSFTDDGHATDSVTVSRRNLLGSAVSLNRSFTPGNVTSSVNEFRSKASCTAIVAVVVAMMGAMMFGIDQTNYGLCAEFQSFYDTWCTPKGYKTNGYPCTPGEHEGTPTPQGWVNFKMWGGSLITLGAAAGCMFLGPLISSRCGRRPCISVGGLVCFLGCLLASYASFNSVLVYYMGRFVTGFGAGVCCFALPMYNSEIAPPAIRGLMGSMFQLMVVAGGVVASVALAFMSDWRLGVMLPGIAGAVVAMLIWFTPESPRFVMDMQGYEAGVLMLQKVRKGDVEAEARAMLQESEETAEAGQVSWSQLLADRGRRRRVFVACYLQVAQQLTGVNAFLSYQTNVFEAAGITADKVNAMPGYALYFSLVMLAGCVCGLVMIDSPYGGRRPQLLVATVIMGPPLIVAGIANLLGWPGWISVIALLLYGPGFQFAWGTIPWVYPSEIFAMNEKDKAVSLATYFNFVVNFAVNMVTPKLLNLSSGITFIVFGLLNVSNFIFVFIYVKETKGVELDRIPALFDHREAHAQRLYDMAAQPASTGE